MLFLKQSKLTVPVLKNIQHLIQFIMQFKVILLLSFHRHFMTFWTLAVYLIKIHNKTYHLLIDSNTRTRLFMYNKFHNCIRIGLIRALKQPEILEMCVLCVNKQLFIDNATKYKCEMYTVDRQSWWFKKGGDCLALIFLSLYCPVNRKLDNRLTLAALF